MIKFILGLLLLSAVSAVSFGDFTEPANASSFDDGKLRALFSIDQTTNITTMYMKYRAYGYFSILFSTKMSGVSSIVNTGRLSRIRAQCNSSKNVRRVFFRRA